MARDGEEHLFNPQTIHKLQKAVRTGNYATFKQYSALVNEQGKKHYTLRGLLDFKKARAGSDRGSRIGRRDRETVQDRRDVLRLDLEGSARGARHRDEPHRRQVQHRRRRRGSRALHLDE